MIDELTPVLESTSEPFKAAVENLYSLLFETVGKPSSKDAVDMLQAKVGPNVNKVDDGDIVGLSAKAGFGDKPLDTDLDDMVTAVNQDMAKMTPLPEMPTEQGMEGLPEGGGQTEEQPGDDLGGGEEESLDDLNDFDMSSTQTDVDVPLPPMDEIPDEETP